MKLKHRLAIYAIITFSIIISCFAFVIYFAFSKVMIQKEEEALENKAVLAAIFYLEQDELTALEHEDIKNQLSRTISRKHIAVYNNDNQQVYGQMVGDTTINPSILKNISRQQKLFFKTKDFFYQGIFYKDNQGEFVVVVRASKEAYNDQLQSLLSILVIVFFVSLIFVYLFSIFLGEVAYKPISQIISQIKNRTPNNFHDPISLRKTYYEIEVLMATYNDFMARIAQSFQVQKNFIDYVSHELRTPITALMGTLEVTKQKARSLEEYHATILKLGQYVNELQATLDHMMLLSGAKTNFEMTTLRIDEIVWKVVAQAIDRAQANIQVEIAVSQVDLLSIQGNEKLLELALSNLLSNAIKYSNNEEVQVKLLETNHQLTIQICDKGIGVLEGDRDLIKQNFYRGKNTQNYQGKGIGLSIANVILSLHHIKLSIYPNQPKGTVIELLFQAF